MITERFLLNCCNRNAPKETIKKILDSFNKYFPVYEINNKLRICSFMSQCSHETGGFIFFKELGGKEYCSKYEPDTPIGKSLGNTKKGDGYKYKGRGIIQLSGRSNYDLYGAIIKKDLINFPDLLLDLDIGTHVACEFWKKLRLNFFADSGDFIGVTKKINGGFNGIKERQDCYHKLLKSFDNENN